MRRLIVSDVPVVKRSSVEKKIRRFGFVIPGTLIRYYLWEDGFKTGIATVRFVVDREPRVGIRLDDKTRWLFNNQYAILGDQPVSVMAQHEEIEQCF